jgi:hypothetical protein
VAAAFTVSWDGRIVDRRLPEETKRFRELATGGRLDELRLTFRPCILGGKSALPITGLEEDFLPRGIVLDLLKLERTADGFLARYRVRAPIGPMSPIRPIPKKPASCTPATPS